MFNSIELIIVIFTLTFAGFAKGISGFGLPIISIPVFALLFDLQQSIAVIIITALFIDILMVYNTHQHYRIQKKRMYTLGAFGIIGTVSGTFLLVSLNESILQMMLSVIIFLFVLSNAFNLLPQFKHAPPYWFDVLVGMIAGGFQGATGSTGPTISMYLMQIKLSRHEFLFLISTFFVVIGFAQVFTLLALGYYNMQLLFYALLALIPSTIGFIVANRIQKYISIKMFRWIVLCLIGLSGVMLLYKSITGLF